MPYGIVVLFSIVLVACGSSADHSTVSASLATSTSSPAGSKPATSASGGDAGATHDGCQAAVASATASPGAASVLDPVTMIRSHQLVGLPAETARPAETGLNRYISADQYLAGTSVPNYATWVNAMAADGFVVAEAIGYRAGTDLYGAEALNFASPAQAVDFQRQTLDVYCARGIIRDVRPIDGVPNSVTFLRTDGAAPYRASLTVGSSVMHLNLCHCLETTDPIGAVAQWGRVIAQQATGRSQ